MCIKCAKGDITFALSWHLLGIYLKGINEPVAQIGFCHPELVSGSHNPLIL